MKVLFIHNRYSIKGGEEESFEAEIRLLQDMGHEVGVYEETNERVRELRRSQVALRAIWSREVYRELRSRLSRSRYDIVHVQNFFPLISPAAHHAARAEGVRVVQSVRNYRLLCPAATLFRQGRVCEDCLGKAVPWPGVLHGCYRESRAGTASVGAMIAAHRALRTWHRKVDLFVALTGFVRDKLIAGGLPADRIVVKPNFVHQDPGTGRGAGDYALFVGRLSPEKGLGTLLQAWQRLAGRIELKIAGEGPLAGAAREGAALSSGVQWLGRLNQVEIAELMGNARFLVCPSEWYEPFGRVAIEAFARGTPVLASDIGGLAELVEHGRTGRLFRPGDPSDLARQALWMLDHPAELAGMRNAARIEFETRYTAERNYAQLLAIYNRALDDPRPGAGRLVRPVPIGASSAV